MDLPTNYSLSYYWCSGFVLSVFVVVQVLTGVFLSFFYMADCLSGFSVIMGLSKDSLFFWFIRYWHILGVRLIFILMFVHMGRALYYSSYIKKGVWNVGFILYLLMMAESFTGYILPWHQMSYWAATVISSIVRSIPVVGHYIYSYIVGDFSISGVTLLRVFSLHVCLGFLILGLIIVHLFYLHKSGTKNPLCSSDSFRDLVYFHSYFSIKDFLSLLLCCTFLIFIMWYVPDVLVDIEAYIPADSLSTPISIKPEWYFLVFYTMLRCIGSKIGGLSLIGIFLFFLWVPTSNFSRSYFIVRQIVFWLIISLFVSLTYFGRCHPEYPYLFICQWFSILLVTFMFMFKLLWSTNSNVVKRC